MKRTPLILLGVLAGLFVTILAFPAAMNLVTDWWWFGSIGYEVVFTTTLATKVILGTLGALLAFVVFYGNFRVAQRGAVPDPIVVNINARSSKLDVTRGLRVIALPASAFLAFLVGVSVSASWAAVLRFLNRASFGVADPVFGRDVGYYVFTLPVVAGAVNLVQVLTFLVLFLVVPLYVMRGDIVLLRNRLTMEPSAQTHVGLLVAVAFLASAVGTFAVRIPSLVYSQTGPFVGASYADLAARLPILRISGVLAVLAAGWVLWGARRRAVPRYALLAIVTYFVFAGIVGAAFPAAMQRFVVVPNELAKERPQLAHHIEASRRAWNLDGVTVRDLRGEADLTQRDIANNSGTIKNVRLWDRDPLLQTFGQLQAIRTYYDFVSVDDDRYWIDGEYRQVLLSPRELNTASLLTRTFINERLTYTHGMGVTLSPVNQVSPEGLPTLFIKDLPPTSSVSLKVTRPEIYYGELSSDFVFVNTQQPEFDFPSADSSAFTLYEGLGGIPVSGLLRKALLSARLKSLKVLLSQDIQSGSRVLFVRNIRDRAEKALPFLRWDNDPYLVITEDGRLVWLMDGYTTSTRYPYAVQLSDGTNYMRNSVKVVIDAYHGDVTAYISDPDDPIIQTYAAMFPGVLQSIDSMPSDLRAHIRYPEDLFRAQTELYAVYHMDEPDIFYHREDQWQVPQLPGTEGTTDRFLRHIVMRLPGEAQEEFIFMTPFTPRQKNNLAAWMVARNDGANYGKLVVYRFPRQSLVFGPRQIMDRINQNTEISRQVSLWDQRGSQVLRGNLLVIPIEGALVYVQALYLRAEGGSIPELKRVIVAYRNQVVMEETLERGLARLFGGPDESVQIASEPARSGEEVIGGNAVPARWRELSERAADHYERALVAQRAGDWSAYGTEIAQLGEVLQQLRRLVSGSSDDGPNGSN